MSDFFDFSEFDEEDSNTKGNYSVKSENLEDGEKDVYCYVKSSSNPEPDIETECRIESSKDPYDFSEFDEDYKVDSNNTIKRKR